jgi:iron-sulfur cluster repair protein YtfE (RIC family)
MKPADPLRKDHAVLRAKLQLLENAVAVGPEACFAIRELVYSIRHRLAEHEEREDAQLYSLRHEQLQKPNSAYAQSLAGQRKEHQRLLSALHRLTLPGMRMPLAETAIVIGQLIASLRSHMDREEQVLFPMLDRLAPSQRQRGPAHRLRAPCADEIQPLL